MPIEHNQVRYFYDIQAWRRELRAVDFVFGSRIHGTLMGIYAGRPTLTIANDERILEMVEQMMLPHDTIYDMPVPQRPGDFDLVKRFRIDAGSAHSRGITKLKSAKNDNDDPSKSPKSNSTIPNPYLNSDSTCGLAATANLALKLFFLTGDTLPTSHTRGPSERTRRGAPSSSPSAA